MKENLLSIKNKGTDNYQSVILADSPLVYYPLTDTSGTAVTNLTGNPSYSASYTGGIELGFDYCRDLSNKSINFNGTLGQYLNISNLRGFLPNSNFSYEVWCKIRSYNQISASSSAHGITFMSNNTNGAAPGGINLCFISTFSSHSNCILYWPLGGKDVIGGNNLIPSLDSLVHVVMVFSGTNLKVYTNNSKIYDYTITLPSTNNNAILTFGRQSWCSGQYNGLMSDLAFYTRALTPEEVSNHYHAGIGS